MSTFAVDILSGKVFLFSGDFSGSGGTSSSGTTYPEVSTYSELPTASSYSNKIYVVRNASGIYLINRKEAGLYYSNGISWSRLGDMPSFFNADNFQIYDNVDTTKAFNFITSGISTNNVRTLTVQDSDGTIAYSTDLDVKLDIPVFSGYTGTTDTRITNNDYFLGNGVVSGFTLSINVDTTKIDIASGFGYIIDYQTNISDPISSRIEFIGQTGITLTYLTSHNVSYLAIDKNSNIIQKSSPFSSEERRDYLILGVAVHSNRTIINAVNNLPDVVLGSHNQFNDFLCALGNFNISGNVFSANGANLYLNKSEGYIFKKGVNFENDNKNPHIKILTGLTAPTNIRYRLSDGTEYAETQEVSKYYESPLGTRVALGNNDYTIQRIIIFPSNLIRIQYGQAVYGSLAEALQNIFAEPFTYEQNILENGLLRGFLIMAGKTTSLLDTTTVKLIEADRFGFSHTGSAAGGTTTLQQAYNNSTIPQITVSETHGEVTIKNDRTLDSSLIQQWLNKAGTWIANLTGEGLFTVKSLKIGDVDGGNYAEIQTNGEIRLYGEATQWDDLRVPVLSTKLGGSKEPTFSKVFDNGAASQGVFTYLFDDTIEQELYFMVQLPHNWKQGSNIEAHVHWFPTVNGAAGQDVCWGLEYTWANIGGVFGNTTIIHGDTNHLAETLVANKQYLTELGNINSTGKTFSSMIICRVFRDATGALGTDDYPNDAALLEIDFHYQIDSLGSDEEYVKYD